MPRHTWMLAPIVTLEYFFIPIEFSKNKVYSMPV